MQDSHIHLFPEEAAAAPSAWAQARGEAWWSSCVAPAGTRSLQGWARVDQLLRDMDEAGIERVVIQGWYWEQVETCREQNRWIASLMRQHPDRLLGFAALQACGHPSLQSDLTAIVEEGFSGIGECKPAVQGGHLLDDEWGELFSFASKNKLPVNLHVTDPVATPKSAPLKQTPLSDFIRLAAKFPEAHFILAHWGGGLPFYELNPRIRGILQNVLYDSAASALLYDQSIYRKVCDIVGPQKVLFGTDYPLLTHPKRMEAPSFLPSVEDLKASGLSAREIDIICKAGPTVGRQRL